MMKSPLTASVRIFQRMQWFHLSRQFIQKGLLTQEQEYGSLKVTAKGIDVLKSRETFMGMLQEENEKVRTLRPQTTGD